MPSTKKQATHRTLCRCLAKSFMSFCGIASFGVINIRKTLGLAVVSTLTLALSATTISLSTPAHAVDSASASTDVTLNLGAAISVRVLDSAATQEISSLTFDLIPTSTGTTGSADFLVDVSTSNATGYKLYMESNYQNTDGTYTTDLVHMDPSATDVIPTLVSPSSTLYWNYVNPRLSTTEVIPSHGSPDIIAESMTPTDSTKTPMEINVSVDTSITAGSYQNQLLFTAIADTAPINYELKFNAASGAYAPEAMTKSVISSSARFKIPTTVPYKEGYGFKGWSESATTETGSGSGPNGLYLPGDNIIVTADGWDDQSKTLYAVYTDTLTFWNISTMQQMSSSLCSSIYTPSNATAMTTPAVTIVDNALDYTNLVSADNQPYVAQRILYDIRDGNSYRVRKLADGNCWMTENLRLEFDGNTTYDSSTTNLALGTTITPSATQARTAEPTAEEIAEWTYDGNRLTTDEAYARDSVNQWRSRSSRGMREADLSVGGRTGENQYLGTYYNWYTATASTGTYDLSVLYAPNDICPTNWQLPRGNDSAQSYDGLLITTYNIISASGEQGDNYTTALSKMNSKPLSIFAAGFVSWRRGVYTNQGTQGIYWAAGNYYWNNKLNAKALNFWPTTIFLANNYKVNGDVIRCVVK